jgi:acetyltransferase-like isoleucine patch superfamily enzyme
MRRLFRRLLRWAAHEHGRLHGLYRRFCNPKGDEYAEYLRRHGGFYSVGEHCFIHPESYITDRPYIRIGNNVRMGRCAIVGHDGSVNMINRAFGLRLDSVGKVDIRDNVFIGFGAIILPGVTIGPNAIVSAGSVVRSDVKEGTVVAGVPARPVGALAMHVEVLKARARTLPWIHLIERRGADFDPALEPELVRMRVEHFYGPAKTGAPGEATAPETGSDRP